MPKIKPKTNLVLIRMTARARAAIADKDLTTGPLFFPATKSSPRAGACWASRETGIGSWWAKAPEGLHRVVGLSRRADGRWCWVTRA